MCFIVIFSGEQPQDIESQKLAPVNPALGDRKKLNEKLRMVPKQFVKRVDELVGRMDNLYTESPSVVAEMQRLEAEVENVLDVVRSWAKGEKGLVYMVPVIDVIGAPKDPSTIITHEKNIGNKILPWLRSHLQETKPGFKVTDLLAFGSPNFVRLQEKMVLECNRAVGKTSAVKKSVLASWAVLARSLGEAAWESIDHLGDDAMRKLRDWYEELATRVGHGVSRMKSFYERGRAEKRQSQYLRDQMPMDQVIRRWLLSNDRSVLQQQLRDTARAIRNDASLQVVPRTYSLCSELVLTELSIYGPVRIGALVRMTVRGFLQSRPAWSSREHRFDPTRPVTLPPPDACQHQKHQKANQAAKCGLNENGERCCEQSIPPTCFLMHNDKDKGGKSDTYIAISAETQRLVSDFLTIRHHFFAKNKPDDGKDVQGTCAIFLNAKGKDPRETSDFKLNLLNKAVFGEGGKEHVTPQQLRKWNTTFLHNHPDAQVAASRGDATGNSNEVFQESYNVTRQSGVFEALLVTLRLHRDQDACVEWSQEHNERQQHDRAAMEEANAAMLFREDGADLTSSGKPVHRHLRKQFEEELERVEPGLWTKAGGGEKAVALSEMKWVYQVVAVLGREEAEHLREVIFQQYRGLEDIQRRQWSSLRSHLETINQERLRGGQSTRNCPLVATLRNFFSSARSANKKSAGGQDGNSSGDDGDYEEM